MWLCWRSSGKGCDLRLTFELNWAIGGSSPTHSPVLGMCSLDCLQQTVGRNVDVKGDPGEVSDRNEKQVNGNWRKSDPCIKVANKLADLCSSVL